MNILILAIVALTGAGIPVQVAANKRLEDAAHSPALATALAFFIGGGVMVLLTLTGLLGRGSFSGLASTPWWAWIGGVLSAAVIVASIVALPKAGEEGVIAATVLGQLIAAALLDHFGWLGVKKEPLNVWRVAGAVLLFAGAMLMQKK